MGNYQARGPPTDNALQRAYLKEGLVSEWRTPKYPFHTMKSTGARNPWWEKRSSDHSLVLGSGDYGRPQAWVQTNQFGGHTRLYNGFDL